MPRKLEILKESIGEKSARLDAALGGSEAPRKVFPDGFSASNASATLAAIRVASESD